MNPFDKYVNEETWLQKTIVTYIKLQYPEWKVIHPPNEGKRTPFAQYLIKLLGVESGVSDLIICAPKESVLFLEVKYGKNKPTENQSAFLTKMEKLGFSSTWCNSFEQAKTIIDQFAKIVEKRTWND